MFRKIVDAVWPPAIRLRREPLPAIAAADQALAEEEPPVSETEIESALRAITAHGRGRAAQRSPDRHLAYLLALQQAEKFALECLEFDRVITRASRIDRAFTIWARDQRFNAVDEEAFSQAIQAILAWRGGHRAIREGRAVYVGCRLRPQVADSLGKPGNSVKGQRN